jgi:hypothetical protein
MCVAILVLLQYVFIAQLKKTSGTTLPLPFLFGCEISSLPLREERRMKVFEKRVLRKIFGPKKEEVVEGWRRLHN